MTEYLVLRKLATAKGDDIGIWGWQPIPNQQMTLAETLHRHGYGTCFVTDDLQQFKASMTFHRGFDASALLKAALRPAATTG